MNIENEPRRKGKQRSVYLNAALANQAEQLCEKYQTNFNSFVMALIREKFKETFINTKEQVK